MKSQTEKILSKTFKLLFIAVLGSCFFTITYAAMFFVQAWWVACVYALTLVTAAAGISKYILKWARKRASGKRFDNRKTYPMPAHLIDFMKRNHASSNASELYERVRRYATGTQDVDGYKRAFGFGFPKFDPIDNAPVNFPWHEEPRIILILFERTSEGEVSAHAVNCEGVYGHGKNSIEARESIMKSILLLKAKNTVDKLPEILRGLYQISFHWDHDKSPVDFTAGMDPEAKVHPVDQGPVIENTLLQDFDIVQEAVTQEEKNKMMSDFRTLTGSEIIRFQANNKSISIADRNTVHYNEEFAFGIQWSENYKDNKWTIYRKKSVL